MRRLTIALTGAVLGTVVLASGALLAAPDQDATVNIDNFTFSGGEITVAPGTKVTWANRDDIPHTVTDAGTPRDSNRLRSTPARHSRMCSRPRGPITIFAPCIPRCRGRWW